MTEHAMRATHHASFGYGLHEYAFLKDVKQIIESDFTYMTVNSQGFW
jgi:hypothetical protein